MFHFVERYLLLTLSVIFQIVIVLFLVRFFVLTAGRVNGQSMEPMFHDNQFFLVNRLAYLLHPPERFDVVQFLHPENKEILLIKRVIGLPGERVNFKRDQIYIQGTDGREWALEEKYLKDDALTRVSPGRPTEIILSENMYFLVGDNRLFSKDSRDFGPIHRRWINGKVPELQGWFESMRKFLPLF